MKTNNTTKTVTVVTTETQNKLNKLMADRNTLLKNGFDVIDIEPLNTELIQTIAQIATYKTLKFLLANNATTETETEQTENGQITSYGFDVSLKLLQTLYNDLRLLKNADITETLTDAVDLVQVASAEIIPYFNNCIVFDLVDTVYTKTLKNGNVKNYTVFALACKSIRKYITDQQQTRQYKKQAYIIGYTDNGTEILTTKKPKNDITDISTTDRQKLLNKYNLTEQEQQAILHKLNGLTTTETSKKMQVSKRTIERTLKSAKNKILAIDKRIKL